MGQQVTNLIAAGAVTLTGAAPATIARQLRGPLTGRWVLMLNYEGLAGDGGGTDTCIPILQTSFDGGATWQDVASAASINAGVVAAVTEYIEALTPKAAARVAASDGGLAASTVNSTALGEWVRLKGKITDADSDGQWRINQALLFRYPP